LNEKIDAIFALDEHASVSGLKMSLKKGYKIPEDLSIIGFADGVWSRRMSPSLSTISQHGPEIGEVAAKLLIEQLEFKGEHYACKTTVVKTELRQRESTKKYNFSSNGKKMMTFGAFLGMIAIVLGAFGAHALKKY